MIDKDNERDITSGTFALTATPYDATTSALPMDQNEPNSNMSAPDNIAEHADSLVPQPVLAGYDATQVTALLNDLKQPRFRIEQVLSWIWKKGILSYDEMSTVPRNVRGILDQRLPLLRPHVARRQLSQDGTRKYLVQFADGEHVEVVGLPSLTRLTVCASTQVGCAMGCTFCATGHGGFVRNLTAAEIVDSILLVAQDFDMRVSNVVMMGQGEPFANYDATLDALRILNAPWGLGIGARHLTVSTSGLISGIERFSAEPEQFTLAVSLHSARQATRDELMPGLSTQPLDKLKDALVDYYDATGRRPSIEYALIAGLSDRPEEIAALGSFASAVGAHVNLIPLNPLGQDGSFSPPRNSSSLRSIPQVKAQELASLLRNRYGVEATVRKRRGHDIDAACGQLRQHESGEIST
jgi:23S rRNA (adenine2503-C2)-methyltransferase